MSSVAGLCDDDAIVLSYAIEPKKEGRHSLRCLMRDPSSGWMRIAVAKSDAIHSGKQSMPQFAGLVVEHAIAYVEMVGTKPIRVVSFERDYWPLKEDGFVDKSITYAWIQEKMGCGNSPSVPRPVSAKITPEEITQIKNALRVVD